MGGACGTYGSQERCITRFSTGNPRERDHLEDIDVEGRIILKWIFKKRDRGHGLDWSASGQGQVAGACECSDEHFDFRKMRVIS
jgi:hypothetical protein